MYRGKSYMETPRLLARNPCELGLYTTHRQLLLGKFRRKTEDMIIFEK
jgi:hypothetical protein